MKNNRKTLSALITEALTNYFRKRTIKEDDEFDLDAYLDTIPEEELKKQYVDYSVFEDADGFKYIEEAISHADVLANAQHAAKVLKDEFGFKDWQIRVLQRNNGISVVLVYPAIYNNKKKITTIMKVEHFFNSRTWFKYKDLMHWQAMKFEPEEVPDVTAEAKQHGVLYHLSPSYNDDQIQSIGLIPANKNTFLKYPARVHLLAGNVSEPAVIYLGQQLFKEAKKDKMNDRLYTFWRINTDKLPKNVVFYGDPNFKVGYYTEQMIPSKCLSRVKTYRFKR